MDDTPSRTAQQRALLPRWPSDKVIYGLLAAGLVAGGLIGGLRGDVVVGLLVGALPGSLAHWVALIRGHIVAWRHDGVERTFVMHDAALSFYIVLVLLLAVALFEAVGGGHVSAIWLFFGATYVEMFVRTAVEKRYA